MLGDETSHCVHGRVVANCCVASSPPEIPCDELVGAHTPTFPVGAITGSEQDLGLLLMATVENHTVNSSHCFAVHVDGGVRV